MSEMETSFDAMLDCPQCNACASLSSEIVDAKVLWIVKCATKDCRLQTSFYSAKEVVETWNEDIKMRELPVEERDRLILRRRYQRINPHDGQRVKRLKEAAKKLTDEQVADESSAWLDALIAALFQDRAAGQFDNPKPEMVRELGC